MTLEEAIEVLEHEYKRDRLNILSDFGVAHKLGIEALRVLGSARFNSNGEWPPLLPGETVETEEK